MVTNIVGDGRQMLVVKVISDHRQVLVTKLLLVTDKCWRWQTTYGDCR